MLWTTPIPEFEHVRTIHAVEILMDQGSPSAYIARDRQQQDWLFLSAHRETLAASQEESWLAVPITHEQRHDLMTLDTVSYQQICENSTGPFRVLRVISRPPRMNELSSDTRMPRQQVPEHWWPQDQAQIRVYPHVHGE